MQSIDPPKLCGRAVVLAFDFGVGNARIVRAGVAEFVRGMDAAQGTAGNFIDELPLLVAQYDGLDAQLVRLTSDRIEFAIRRPVSGRAHDGSVVAEFGIVR